MTYFPAAHTPTTVKVAKYREALHFAEYVCNKVEYPSCTRFEVIRERSNSLMSIFRAMRELQGLHCNRRSADDKERYTLVMAKAARLVDQYKSEYFEDPDQLSSSCTDEQIYDNWIGSGMADSLTYLLSPALYPEKYQATLRKLGVKKEVTTKKRHLQLV